MEAFTPYAKEGKDIICLCITTKFSGSYNSAKTAEELLQEKYPGIQIQIVDTSVNTVLQGNLVLEAVRMQKNGLSFEETVKELEAFREEMKTYFILDNLETLRKNGRLTGVKAMVVSTLNIKPIMYGDHGVIKQKSQSVGMKKAIVKLTDIMVSEVPDMKDRTLMISHCNCPDRAAFVKKELLAKTQVKDILVMDTAGISSMYANDGGIVVTI